MKFTPVKYDEEPQMIISKYNGRVSVLEPTDPDARFRLYERMAVNNKATAYREALTGESEWNKIAEGYFSADNLQHIQDSLKTGVFHASSGQFVIAPQNAEFLKIIMRNIYLQNVEHSTRETADAQIQKLNQLVLDELVPKLHSEAIGYFRYLQDQSTLVVPLELPRAVDRDYKPLAFKENLW